jgi:hypothetical protein
MENMSAAEVWGLILAAASAIVLLLNTAEKISKAVQAAKAPNQAQNERLDDLEEWRKEMTAAGLPGRVDALEEWRTDATGKLDNDKKELDAIHDGMRVSHLAQLALLDHALNGNNITQMEDAKSALQTYLANK